MPGAGAGTQKSSSNIYRVKIRKRKGGRREGGKRTSALVLAEGRTGESHSLLSGKTLKSNQFKTSRLDPTPHMSCWERLVGREEDTMEQGTRGHGSEEGWQ